MKKHPIKSTAEMCRQNIIGVKVEDSTRVFRHTLNGTVTKPIRRTKYLTPKVFGVLDVRITIRELQSKFLCMLPQVCKQPALQPKTRLSPTSKYGTPNQRKTN
jgi:hypothetical protein